MAQPQKPTWDFKRNFKKLKSSPQILFLSFLNKLLDTCAKIFFRAGKSEHLIFSSMWKKWKISFFCSDFGLFVVVLFVFSGVWRIWAGFLIIIFNYFFCLIKEFLHLPLAQDMEVNAGEWKKISLFLIYSNHPAH